MRLLIYNIAYGTGAPRTFYHQLWTIHRYLRTSQSHLDRIIHFIDHSNADVVGLLEVDIGSFRTNFINQVEVVANHLKHYHHCHNKYGMNSLLNALPYLKKQANALLTRNPLDHIQYHFFPFGMKRLIIEAQVNGVRFILVHLALREKTRALQLEYLAELVQESQQPLIIAGDFNLFRGTKEIDYLQRRLKLRNANPLHLPTYPSWSPRKQLDFILCSDQILIKEFTIPHVRYSDHLPLLLDFEVSP